MGGAQLDHFACTNEQHIVFAQVFKQLTSQAHRGSGHADAVGANFSAAAHLLGDSERTLEHLVQGGTQSPRLAGHAHRVFQLTQDLRLAQDHRIETTGHAKRMACGFIAQHAVSVAFEGIGADAPGLGQPRHGLGKRHLLRGTVNFGAVAGGEDGGFGLAANALAKTFEHRTHLFDSKGKAPPQIKWCGGVVETERPNRHSA